MLSFVFCFCFFQFHSPTTQRPSAKTRPGNSFSLMSHNIEQLEDAAFNKFWVKDQLRLFLWKILEQTQPPAFRVQGDRRLHVAMATGLHSKSRYLKASCSKCAEAHKTSEVTGYPLTLFCSVGLRSASQGLTVYAFIQASFSWQDCWDTTDKGNGHGHLMSLWRLVLLNFASKPSAPPDRLQGSA